MNNNETVTARFNYQVISRGRKLLAMFFGALLTTLVITGLLVLVMWVSSWFSSYALQQNVGWSFALLLGTVYLTFPPLINSRFGWKTVAVTYVVQAVFVTIAIIAVTFVTEGLAQNSRYDDIPTYDTNIRSDGANKAQ